MAKVYLIAAIAAAIDQATKAWVRLSFEPGESIPVIAGLLHLTHLQNRGAAFGLFEGRLDFVVVATLAMIAAVLAYSRKIARSGPWIWVGYGLALGGAVGNLVDRLRFGSVTDFVDFRVWPVFNVADTAIFTGVCLLLWRTVIAVPKTGEKPGEEREGQA